MLCLIWLESRDLNVVAGFRFGSYSSSYPITMQRYIFVIWVRYRLSEYLS